MENENAKSVTTDMILTEPAPEPTADEIYEDAFTQLTALEKQDAADLQEINRLQKARSDRKPQITTLTRMVAPERRARAKNGR